MTWPVWLSKFSFRSISLNETSDGVNKLNLEKATQATEIRDELNAGKWNLSSSFTSPAEFQIENAVFFSVHSQTSRGSYNGSNGNKNYIAYLCCRAHIKSCEDFLIWMTKKLKKKGGKIFENLGKNVQNLKIFWKKAGDCMRLSHTNSQKMPCFFISSKATV